MMTPKKLVLWTFVALIIVALGWLGWRGVRAAGQARLALSDLTRLQALADDPSPEAIPQLQDELAALEMHLVGTRSAAGPFLWLAPRLGWLPKYGPTVRSAPSLLDMAIEGVGAGRQALDALAPLMDSFGGQGEGDLMGQAIAALATAGPDLAAVDARLAQVQALRASVTGPLHPRIASLLDKLDGLLPLARDGLKVAQVVPVLLGMDGPRSYLILAQNNHELRATGGFISGAGVIRVEDGRIVEMQLGDSYAVDNYQQPHPAPPRPLMEHMGAQMLVLRDSNWSPDFPTSAQVARALFLQDQGVATDGAIAVDLEAVRLLVAALEPLDVPGMDEPVTKANVIAQIKRSWESPPSAEGSLQDQTGGWWRNRKDFMADLIGAAMTKLENPADLDLVALARAALAMLDGRHLQIAVDDPVLRAVLAERGWDGGLRPPAGSDFLAVVDSNVGFNKANAAVQEEIAYRVDTAEGGLIATLTLTYVHTSQPFPPEQLCDHTARYGNSYDELIRRCYWDYLRVYAPGGSELLEGAGLDRVESGLGERLTAVFAGDFVLRPGDEHRVTLRYRLPADLAAEESYRLAVHKQAGTIAWPLTVEALDCAWTTDLAVDRPFQCGG